MSVAAGSLSHSGISMTNEKSICFNNKKKEVGAKKSLVEEGGAEEEETVDELNNEPDPQMDGMRMINDAAR